MNLYLQTPIASDWVDSHVTTLRRAKVALDDPPGPELILESLPFGGDMLETMPMDQAEADEVAKKFKEKLLPDDLEESTKPPVPFLHPL